MDHASRVWLSRYKANWVRSSQVLTRAGFEASQIVAAELRRALIANSKRSTRYVVLAAYQQAARLKQPKLLLILQRAKTCDLPKASIQARPAHAACCADVFGLEWPVEVLTNPADGLLDLRQRALGTRNLAQQLSVGAGQQSIEQLSFNQWSQNGNVLGPMPRASR